MSRTAYFRRLRAGGRAGCGAARGTAFATEIDQASSRDGIGTPAVLTERPPEPIVEAWRVRRSGWPPAALAAAAPAARSPPRPLRRRSPSTSSPGRRRTNRSRTSTAARAASTKARPSCAGTAAGLQRRQPAGAQRPLLRPSLSRRERSGHSGTRAISLIGCATAANSPTPPVSSSSTGPPTRSNSRSGLRPKRRPPARTSSAPKSGPTAFRTDRSIVMQQQTLLGPNTNFKGVPLALGRGRHRLRRDRAGQQGIPDRLCDRRRPRLLGALRLSRRRRPHLRPAVLAAGKQLPARRLALDRPLRARDEIAADQNPGHLDGQPEPFGEPGPAGTHRAVPGSPAPSRRTRPTPASRPSSSKPKNGGTRPVHGDRRRLRRQRGTVREALERADPHRSHRTVRPRSAFGDHPVSRCTPDDVADPDRQGSRASPTRSRSTPTSKPAARQVRRHLRRVGRRLRTTSARRSIRAAAKRR